MKNLLIAFLVLAVLPLTAFAGDKSNGGGTKKNATLKIVNKSLDTTLAVILDKQPTAAQLADLDAFKAAGGFTIEANASKSVALKSGSHKIYAAFIDANTDETNVQHSSQTVSLPKNKTTTVEVSDDVNTPPTYK